jgi:hypothetical protein
VGRFSRLICELSLKAAQAQKNFFSTKTNNHFKIEKIPAFDIEKSKIIPGVVILKDVSHPKMRRKILKPKIVIPFGANLMLDDGDAFSDINHAVKTPLEFSDYVKNNFPELQHIITAMHAGDFCYEVNGLMKTAIDENLVSVSYREVANEFLKSRAKLPRALIFEEVNLDIFLESLNVKLKNSAISTNQIIRLELNYCNKVILIEIDCLCKIATLVSSYTSNTNYHHFKLDSIASGHWLNGKRFEEIIGMRRFRLKRVPNIYSKDLIRLVSTVL